MLPHSPTYGKAFHATHFNAKYSADGSTFEPAVRYTFWPAIKFSNKSTLCLSILPTFKSTYSATKLCPNGAAVCTAKPSTLVATVILSLCPAVFSSKHTTVWPAV